MGKLVTIATKARFDALREASNISETSLNFILETGQLYTHNIFINGASFGTATSNYIPVKIGGVTKNLSLNGHTHSNYYDNSSDIDIGSNKIKSGTQELLKYSSDILILGNSSIPTEFFGTLKTTKDGTKYTILDTNNFSIVNKTSTNLTLNNVALFKYGSSSFQLDYVRRYNTVETFNNLAKYTSAGTTNENSKAYGFITLSTDTGTNTYSYAQIRVSIPDNILEFRTSSDTTWKGTLLGGTYRNITINGTTYSIVTKAGSLPTIIAPTALGTSGQYLTTSDDGKSLTWRTIPTDNNTWRPIAVNGTEKRSSSTGSGNLDIINGTNTTVEWTSGNKLKINAVDTWTAWKGATDSANGTAGYMPAPTSAQRGQFLRGDGSWVSLNNYSLPTASNSTLGGVKTGAAITDTTGYTAVAIKDGVIYYKDTNTTYSFSNLQFQQTSGTNLMTYNSQATRTVLAGSNITFTHSNNILTITAKDTTYSTVSKSAAGLCPTLPNETTTTKYLRQDGSWVTPPNDNTWKPANTSQEGYVPKSTANKILRANSDGVLYWGDDANTTYTFYNLQFQNSGGTTVDTYKPTTSPTKTLKAGANVTISAASDVITIASTNTWNANAVGVAGYVAAPTKAANANMTWQTDAEGVPAWRASNNHSHSYLPLSGGTVSGVIKPNANSTINLGENGAKFHYLYVHRLVNVQSICNGTTYDSNKLDLPSKSGTIAVTSDLNSYLPLSGGQMTGPLTWKDGTALPEQTSPLYFIVIDAFASGGTTKWSSVANVKTALGLGSNAYTSTAYLPLTGGTLTGNLSFSNSGTGFRGINYGTMGDNDQWRIGGAATGSNGGYMEISTADDGNEPIYVRQYTGVFSTLIRTLTLLDASGNTSFPGKVTSSGTITSSGFVKSGSDDNYFLLGGGGHVARSSYASSGHTHNYITSLGNKDASDLSSTYPNGLSVAGIYNNGYPFTFGSTITAKGNGGYFQIAGQWNNAVSSLTDYDYPTELYIRGRRDSYDVWTTWTRVLTNRNWSSVITLPTKASWNYDDRYVSSLTINGNSLRWVKNGSNNDITIPYASNAGVATRSKFVYHSGIGTAAYVSGDTHIMYLGYLEVSNYGNTTLMISSSFWGNQHNSVDLITIANDFNTNGNKLTQATVQRVMVGGSYERKFYCKKETNGNTLRVHLTVYVEGGNSYGNWYISIPNSNDGALWHTDGTKNYNNTGFSEIPFSGKVSYALNAGSIAWANVTSKPETATRWPSWSEVTSKPSTFTPSSHDHDGRYSYSHQPNASTFNFNIGHNSNYVTFDGAQLAGAPDGSWYNGFVSTHNNYLSSYLINQHRTSNWYVGYSENTTAPTWYKLYHTGNLTNLNQLANGPGYITNRGHRLGYRHIDAGPKSSWSDSRLYLGYNGFNDADGATESIGFYRSTGTDNRTLWAEVNANGLYALTRFGVNGQNTGYNFYVNGTSYLNGETTVHGNLNVGASSTSNYIQFFGLTGDNPAQASAHYYIGNRHWADGESSEMLIFSGNDMGNGNSATTQSGAGPDRFRVIAAAHLFQTYTSALSGSFESVATSSVLKDIFEINTNNIKSHVPFISTVTTGTAPIQVSSTTLNTNLNADLLDGYHESSFLRYRSATNVNGEATLWSQLGLKQYSNALPDGLSGTYNYGQVVSFATEHARFEIYASHASSESQGLYYRSGWGNDKKPWLHILDSYNSSVSKSGETLTVKINGATQSLTNTIYSANNGVGLSGTTFYNTGVRATTINGNYLRVNTNGTNADLTIPYATNAYQLHSVVTVNGGNTSTYLWRRIAFSGERTSNWNDCDALILIKHNYNGGRFGLLKISFRTDNIVDEANASASATWLVRVGFAADSVKAALYKVKGKAYADIYLSVGTYPRCTIHVLKTSGWTFYDSIEKDGSADPVNAYTSIESAATTIHGVAYTSITNSGDGATVNYANSAGSVTWTNVSSKPETATRWPKWTEVTDKPSTFTPSSHTHSYLPLSGGTLSNAAFGSQLMIERSGGANMAAIGFKNSNGVLGYLATNTVDGTFVRYNAAATTFYTILDSSNSSVSKSGSTLTVKINGTSQSITDTNTWRGIQDNLTSSSNTTESLSAKQGYLLANGSARDSTKLLSEQVSETQTNVTWAINYAKTHRRAFVYNTSSTEWSYLFGLSSSNTSVNGENCATYGVILKMGYTDKYLRILRVLSGKWYKTDGSQADVGSTTGVDWEKISAGYADSAGTASLLSGYGQSDFIHTTGGTITTAKNSNTTSSWALKIVQGTDNGSGSYDSLIVSANDVPAIRISDADGTQLGLSGGDAHGTITSTHDLRFFVNSTANSSIYSGAEGTQAMTILSSGNVGIGTTSPSSKLHISGGLAKVTNNSNTVTIGSDSAAWCHIYNSADIPFIFNKSVYTIGSFMPYSTDNDLGSSSKYFRTGYISKVSIGSNQYRGNSTFGINMNDSDLVGCNSIVFADGSDDYTEGLMFPRNSDGSVYDTFRAVDGTFKVGFANGSEFITMTGSIIKHQRPDATDVSIRAKNSNGEVSILTSTNRGLYDHTAGNWIVGTNGSSTWLSVGNVGIGTTSPSYKLHISGNCAASNFYTTSDRNKKQNISILSEHIRKFQLKDTEKWHYGVIAQEVEEMFRDGEEGNMTVNYNSILSYYIGQLENKVALLEKELNSLKQKLK